MMEAVSNSETLVDFYETTRRNNPEDSRLYTRRGENLKSQWFNMLLEKKHTQAFLIVIGLRFT
jgi:hypothetical protein